jgi:NAD(P)-dependent dehydrogenase (short-subunit alcohol dehydrogenase family)
MFLERFALDGKTAIITGGFTGIGFAIGQAFLQVGARVVLAGLLDQRYQEQITEIGGLGDKASVVELDVTRPEMVDQVFTQIIKEEGGIDVLVTSAGIALTNKAEEIPKEEWLKIIDVNLNGVFWCCQRAGKQMLQQGHGAIVNIGSMSGHIVNHPQLHAHYNVSKAAVHHLTRSLGAEWASRGVRVNAVAPTYIDTAMSRQAKEYFDDWKRLTPMNRLGTPSEVAAAVLFLATESSSLVTGTVLNVDGGYTAW